MSALSPVWLEVALNGAAGQQLQPGIPVAPEDIIRQAVECADAGAAVIHLHAYDDAGQPVEEADIYARIIEGVREQRDVIVYPTLGLSGSLEERYAPIRELAQRGLLEWGVVDPGSVNITHEFQVAAGTDGILYPNPDSHIRAGLELAVEYGWRPAYAIYEPGFARLGAALAGQYPDLLTPVYRIMFSDHLLFGTPPSEDALRFYAGHLEQTCVGAPWMLSGLDADVEAIMPLALELGAHIRVGLEDAPFGCQHSNLQLVQRAVDLIAQSGRSLASVEQVRSG